MPYKNKMQQREANRLAKQRERGVIPKVMSYPDVIPVVNVHYQALAQWLVDPVKKEKLDKICNALDKKVTGLAGETVNLGSMVNFGIGGPSMDMVKELL